MNTPTENGKQPANDQQLVSELWWEERAIEEMPEYLKFHERIIKIEYWERDGYNQLCGWSNNIGYYPCDEPFYPATSEEYTQYLSQIKSKD